MTFKIVTMEVELVGGFNLWKRNTLLRIYTDQKGF